MSTQNISKKEKAPETGAICQTAQGNNKITDLNHTSEKEKSQVTFEQVDCITTTLSFINDIVDVISDSASHGICSREVIGDALYFTTNLIGGVIGDCRRLIPMVLPDEN